MFKVFSTLMPVAIVLGLTACGSSTSPQTTPPNPPANAKKIIVIGAGMSGIKAANQLANAGLQVQVLEARDRIGGRTWSDRSWGVAVDLGASWIHGISGNPIHTLAQSLNTPLVEWDYDNQTTYDASGNIDNSIDTKIESANDAVLATANTTPSNDPNITLQDLVDQTRSNGALNELTERELEFFVNSSFEQDIAADADKVSFAALTSTESFLGPDVVFPQGYDTLVTALADGLDIKLNTYVNAIDYQGSIVSVQTSQGTYTADYVIVTVPLGVLKKDVILFNPSLPQEKLNAIEALDMGVLNKVYLRFPEVFWDNNVDNLAQISEQKGHWSYWINLSKLTSQPILLGFNVASFGTEIESLSNQEIVSQAMVQLRKFFGDNIPEPSDSI
ncbi:MAG: FAD-dependent oxidoreductase, partial [Kangiellaceae bacterium]|nr:FAD-dependent oxidoreductase [Kangiellaceae bacterium]